eukprot:SAG31_NODE_22761_length_518_cov_1.076372_2_plen_48_part_01
MAVLAGKKLMALLPVDSPRRAIPAVMMGVAVVVAHVATLSSPKSPLRR